MSSNFAASVKKKAGVAQKQIKILISSDDDIMALNNQKFTRDKYKFDSPALKIGKQLTRKSLRMVKNESREYSYEKSKNINLGDYLMLTSLSKRSERSENSTSPKSRFNNKKEKVEQPENEKKEKAKNVIDIEASVKIVREETKKQLNFVKQKLQNFLDRLDNCQQLSSDAQSLVFMCNVLHIFQDKIAQSAKYAQALTERRKIQKNIFIEQSSDFMRSPTRRTGQHRSKFTNYLSTSSIANHHSSLTKNK